MSFLETCVLSLKRFSALLLHLFSFAIVIMNIPANANIEETDDVGVFFAVPNRTLALVVGVMLGLGEAVINNVIYSTISTAWKDESVSAFALMKVCFDIDVNFEQN